MKKTLIIKEIPNEIELIREGELICKWKRADGSWDSFTRKVKENGHWGRFLVFEEDKTEPEKVER